MRFNGAMLLTVTLAGCGAEVAGTAATAAAAKAEEARQAEQMKGKVQQSLDAAMQAEQERLKAAEQAAGQ